MAFRSLEYSPWIEVGIFQGAGRGLYSVVTLEMSVARRDDVKGVVVARRRPVRGSSERAARTVVAGERVRSSSSYEARRALGHAGKDGRVPELVGECWSSTCEWRGSSCVLPSKLRRMYSPLPTGALPAGGAAEHP